MSNPLVRFKLAKAPENSTLGKGLSMMAAWSEKSAVALPVRVTPLDRSGSDGPVAAGERKQGPTRCCASTETAGDRKNVNAKTLMQTLKRMTIAP